jgi:phage baseplate assembly protein W
MAQKFVGVVLPIRLGNTGMFNQSVDMIEQARTNFKSLILTKKGERVAPSNELGCDLWNILFEQSTDDITERARLAVVSAVERWLSYLEITKFDLIRDDETSTITINCIYRFRSNPNITQQVEIVANSVTPFSALTVNFLTEEQQRVVNMAERIRRKQVRT